MASKPHMKPIIFGSAGLEEHFPSKIKTEGPNWDLRQLCPVPRHALTFFRWQREHWLKTVTQGNLLFSLHFFLFHSQKLLTVGDPLLRCGIYPALKGLKQRDGREVKGRLFSSVTQLEPNTAALLQDTHTTMHSSIKAPPLFSSFSL